jgi:Uri superfamily endonuclease
MRLPQDVAIDVGKLGRFSFPAGWYAYAGSACGPGGLGARLARHRRAEKILHWHVDHLRARARLISIWYSVGSKKRECDWARALSQLPGASVVAPGFGASDCPCSTHLLHYSGPPDRFLFAGSADGTVLEEVFDE